MRAPWARCAAMLSVTAILGCRPHPPPAPGATRGGVPDLQGAQVMVLPVQATRGVAGNPDAELGYALETRGDGVRWLMPGTLRDALARSPALDVPLDALPVGMFLRVRVDRVGDPLYGQLRRLAALTGGRLALVPVEVRHRATTPERPGAIEMVAALLDVGTGRVLWFGVAEGEPGDGGSARALASAADALARQLLPLGTGS